MKNYGRIAVVLFIITLVAGIAFGIIEVCKGKCKWDFDPECSVATSIEMIC